MNLEVHVSVLPSMLWSGPGGVLHYIPRPLHHCSSIPMDFVSGYTPPAIPIHVFRAFYSEERSVYSRMVFSLAMDPVLSMDVVAFWLWLSEENGQPNAIKRLNLLKNEELRSIAEVTQTIVLALRFQPPPAVEATQLLPSPSPDLARVLFHRDALRGVNYFLKKVCIKAFSDIRDKADQEHAKVNLQTAESPMLSPSQGLLGAGQAGMDWAAAAAAAKPGNPFLVLLGAGQGIAQLPVRDIMTDIGGSPPPPLVGVGAYMDDKLVEKKEAYFTPPDYQCTCFPPQEPYILMEERMLFVTFSNGYPFSPKELHSFFMREYGDVEMVEVHSGTGKDGVAFFAYVAFYTVTMVQRILNGNVTVKFVSNGKDLWARRFIPSLYFPEAK